MHYKKDTNKNFPECRKKSTEMKKKETKIDILPVQNLQLAIKFKIYN